MQSIRVSAGQYRDITLGMTIAVTVTSRDEQIQVRGLKIKRRTRQRLYKARGPGSMLRIVSIVHAPGIVQEGKQLDHFHLSPGHLSQT